MADKLSGCGCCGGCRLKTMDTVGDWVIDSGTLTDSAGRLYFAGDFTPASPIAAEAFSIVMYDFEGILTFTVDSIDYQIDATSLSSISISAGANTKLLVRSVIGDMAKKLAVQIRITPTHGFIIVAESSTPPTIVVETNQIQLVGKLHTMVTVELASPTTGEFSMTGTADVDRFRIGTSTPDCFLAPDVKSAYYGYLALLGGTGNETTYPGYLIPDALINEPGPVEGTHLLNFGTDEGPHTDGFGSGLVAGPSHWDKRGTPHASDDSVDWGRSRFIGNYARKILASGLESVIEIPVHLTCLIKAKFPASTMGTPYPLPVYEAAVEIAGGFNQPTPATSSPSYIYTTPDPDSIDPDEGKAVVDIPINDMGDGVTIIDVETDTYSSETTADVGLYPAHTAFTGTMSGTITL